MRTIKKQRIVTAVAAVVLIVMTAGAAGANDRGSRAYTDQDSWWIRMLSRAAQPVGIVLEGAVSRPYTALTRWSDPHPNRYRSVTTGRECTSLRPYRYCSTKGR